MMKKRNMTKWLVLGGLLLLVGLAAADYNVQDHGTHYQNASTGLRTNSTGVLLTQESTPPQDFQVFEPAWLSTRLQARLAGGLPPTVGVFVQDSTTAVDVRGANGLALMLYPTFDDSVSAVALAIQYRWHFSSVVDSQSTFIEMGSKKFSTATASATVRDSLGSFLFQNAASNGASRYTVGATDSLATPDEEVIVLTNIGGVNRGRMIRITPPNAPSGNVSGPFLSIRIRYLNGYGTTAFIAWGNGVSGFEPILNLRADLVGWR